MKKNLFLTFVSIVVSLLLAEGLFWATGFEFPTKYVYDNDRGWSLRPGAKGWHKWVYEGESYLRINQDGLRGPEYSIAKPEMTYRIAVLGDSFTESQEVYEEQSHLSVIQNRLRNCEPLSGNKIEVINFGVGRYSTAQEYITLKTKAIKYMPDLVILSFFTGNDVIESTRKLSVHGGEGLYATIENGEIKFDYSFRRNLEKPSFRFKLFLKDVVSHSRVLQLVNQGYRGATVYFTKLKSKRAAEEKRKALSVKGGEVVPGLDAGVYDPMPSEDWQQAWSLTERLILETRNLAVESGSAFRLVVIPAPIQVFPNQVERERYLELNGLVSFDYPESRLKSYTKRHSIPASFLYAAILKEAESRNERLYGDPDATPGNGHFNIAGHDFVGRLLAKDICAMLSQHHQQ